MKTNILEPVPNKNPKKMKRVFTKYMHGDADRYSTEYIDIVPNSPVGYGEVKELLMLIEAMRVLYRMTSGCTGEHYKDLKIWHDAWKRMDAGDASLASAFIEEVPADNEHVYERKATLEAWYMRYYDDNQVEHEVEIIFTKEEKDEMRQMCIEALRKSDGMLYGPTYRYDKDNEELFRP